MTFDSFYNVFSLPCLFSILFWIPAAMGLYLPTNKQNELSFIAACAGLLVLDQLGSAYMRRLSDIQPSHRLVGLHICFHRSDLSHCRFGRPFDGDTGDR
jgi:hypothetical protein